MSAADAAWEAVRARLLGEPEVEQHVAFHAPGLRYRGRIVAMRMRDDLVVKLTPERCAALVAAGEARPFESGTRRMRAWVALGDPDPARWTAYAEEALALARAAA